MPEVRSLSSFQAADLRGFFRSVATTALRQRPSLAGEREHPLSFFVHSDSEAPNDVLAVSLSFAEDGQPSSSASRIHLKLTPDKASLFAAFPGSDITLPNSLVHPPFHSMDLGVFALTWAAAGFQARTRLALDASATRAEEQLKIQPILDAFIPVMGLLLDILELDFEGVQEEQPTKSFLIAHSALKRLVSEDNDGFFDWYHPRWARDDQVAALESIRSRFLSFEFQYQADLEDQNGSMPFCKSCTEPTAKSYLCDRCWFEKIQQWGGMVQTSRSHGSFPETIAERFAVPRSFVESLMDRIPSNFYQGVWLHPGNAGEVRGLALSHVRFEENWNQLFLDDFNFAVEQTTIPEHFPYKAPSGEIGRGLATAFTLFPPLGFVAMLRNDSQFEKEQRLKQPPIPPQALIDAYRGRKEAARAYLNSQIDHLVESVLQAVGQSPNPDDWATQVANRWIPKGPLPSLPVGEITPEEAEQHVARWLLFFGEDKVETTRFTQDGGVDVISENVATQVKHQLQPVGPQVVREIFGVATSLGKLAAVFSRSGFTKSAIGFAQDNDVMLFQYEPELIAKSESASRVLETGIS